MVHGLETIERLNNKASMVELPRYKSHKIVHALKIHAIDMDLESGAAVITPEDQGYGPFSVDAEYIGKHMPRIGGYYVVYDDGYKSWSPADAFENGYVKVDGYHSPLTELQKAIQANEDYAWTWLCNLACIGMDSGGNHENANRYAAQFMKNAFDVDVRTQELWKKCEEQWAKDKATKEQSRAFLAQRIDAARAHVEGMNFLKQDDLVAFSIYRSVANLQVEPSVMVRVCTHLNDVVPWIVPETEGLHLRAVVEGLEVVCICDTPEQASDIVGAMKVFK